MGRCWKRQTAIEPVYKVRNGIFQGKNKAAVCCKGMWQHVPHRGFKATSFPKALYAMSFAISITYYGRFLPTSPVSDGTPKKCDRNAAIRARYQQGETVATLATVFGISEQRVAQILRGQRK